ncbi:ABC transporter permease [Bacillus sp. UNC438CL73TsuS30]|uniref:ABC transporter permease n=1 Tax=Bacillus sp. UNC438CL73TsuS30 TaxID=1340434 RepID=UPI00047EE702|nr:ABC transporter permease [Bacillus sp. UNC438CL73TsuS30]
MSLLKWELMKIFKQKSLYIIGIFLFGWFTMIAMDVENQKITQEVFKKWEGPITTEKVEKAEKVNRQLTEFFSKQHSPDQRKSAESAVVENIAYSQNIKTRIKEWNQDLNKLIIEAREKGNTSLANKLELQKKMYNEVKLDRISYSAAPREAIDFVNVFGLIISGVFLLIGLSGIYSNEHSSGVENYILSTKNGRVKTMRAKLLAAFIFAAVVVFSWEGFNLMIRTLIYGTKGWDLPIQYSYKYFTSPYSLTFMEYHLIQIGIHLLAALAFAGVMVLVSTLSKSTVISFFVSGFLFGVPLLTQSIMDVDSIWLNKALTFTLTNIMKVEDMYMNFVSVNIFGLPVLAPYIGIMVSVITLSLSIFLARFLIRKKQIA